MQKFYCNVPIASLHVELDNSLSPFSQLLYGEEVFKISEQDLWAKVSHPFLGENLWIDSRHLTPEREENKNILKKDFSVCDLPEGRMLLSIGSEVVDNNIESTVKLEDLLTNFLNVPFCKTGRSFFGVDGLGFLQIVFKILNKNLPLNLKEISALGESLFFLEEGIAGDIAFFDDEQGNIIHAGILLDNSTIVHVADRVRKDSIDSTGIYNKDLNNHTHHLRFIKRVL